METAVVVLMTAAAAVFTGRNLLKTLRGEDSCPGGCSGCPMNCAEKDGENR